MGCTSVELSSCQGGRNIRLQRRISYWSNPPLQMQASPSYDSMLQPGWQLPKGFTLKFFLGSYVYWALTQLKPPKTHGGEARHPWVTRADFLQQLLQWSPGPSVCLTCRFCVPMSKDTAEQTAVLEEVWFSTGGRNNFRAPTAVPFTQACVLLLLALMLLRA